MAIIYFLIAFLLYTPVHAAVLLEEIPDYLVQQSYYDLSHRALKRACTASLAVPATSPCNPISLLSLPDDDNFFANFYISDKVDFIRKIDDLINENKTVDAVEKILNENDPVNAQISASLNYTSNNFALSVIPIRASIFSFTTNPVNPQAATYAKKDREAKLQYIFDTPKTSNWRFGINARYLYREYVLDEYTLLDAIFDIDQVLPSNTYKAFYIEPAISYFFDNDWLPRISFYSENTVFPIHEDSSNFSDKPFLNLGFGLNPPVPLGLLELLVNYSHSMNSKFDESSTIRFGTRYTLGLMNVSFAIDEYDTSLGIFSTLWSLRFGILYENRKYDNVLGEEREDESILSEFSYIF